MRPHGKLWGMDVFSWFHPEAELVANTLHSFPFPVIWIANGADIIAALNEDELVLNNLHALIAYDSSIFDLKNSWSKNINIIAGTASISEAFQLLNTLKSKHKVLMFTASSENWKEDKKTFEEFLKLVQV